MAVNRGQALDTAIDQVCTLIQTVTANPKPTYSVDGESVSWESYLARLNADLRVMLRNRQDVDGPFEVRSRAG
jgi:hypothetical protein